MRVNRREYDETAGVALSLLIEAVSAGVAYYETHYEGFTEPLVRVDMVIGPLDDNMIIEVHMGGRVFNKPLVDFGSRVVIRADRQSP